MRTAVLFGLTMLASISVSAATKAVVIHKTLPNSSIVDYRGSHYVKEGDTVYKTLPNSNIKDYRETFKIEERNVKGTKRISQDP